MTICADDTKIYRQVNTRSDHTAMQADLEKLKNWSEKWQLRFNDKKCKVMHLGKHLEGHPYQLGQAVMSATECERDLGVLVDRELKFHQHTTRTVKRTNQIFGLIRRSFYDQESKIDYATL